MEEDPEDDQVDDWHDEQQVIATGQFAFKKYDFIETSMVHEPHEMYEDVIDQKIFKYKYRQCNETPEDYERKQDRVLNRFFERARARDPRLETDLFELY